jgi:hypothetical protein
MTDPVAFAYILHFLKTGRLIDDVDPAPPILSDTSPRPRFLKTVRAKLAKARPIIKPIRKSIHLFEILQEAEFFQLDSSFTDKVV